MSTIGELEREVISEISPIDVELARIEYAFVLDHDYRVQEHTKKLVDYLGLSIEEQQNGIRSARLHDIGKLLVPLDILLKPTRPTDAEMVELQKHVKNGYLMLTDYSRGMEPIAKNILFHHERWDGSGYPSGMQEHNIPKLARIIAITDSYDTMVNGTTYRGPVSQEQALAEIVSFAGSKYDPELTEAFIDMTLKA
ncbi:MAG: HD domain-containing protein [bacterium]|nr:HD domain-containing protein [bacterium]